MRRPTTAPSRPPAIRAEKLAAEDLKAELKHTFAGTVSVSPHFRTFTAVANLPAKDLPAPGARLQPLVDLEPPRPGTLLGPGSQTLGPDGQQSRPDAGDRLRRAAAGGIEKRQLYEPLRADLPAVRRLHGRQDPLPADRTARRHQMGAAGRLFFDRIRPAREPADLFRRPRHALRRPPQDGQRLEHPPRRHRPPLQERVLQAGHRQERHPDGGVSGERFLQHAGPDRPGRPGRRRADLPGPARADALRQHLGGPRGARLALPPGHRRPAEHPAGPENHGTPLLRRTADEDRAGDPPRDGGDPRPRKGWGSAPASITSTRGTRPFFCSSGSAR